MAHELYQETAGTSNADPTCRDVPELLTILVRVTVARGTLSVLPETRADMLTRDVVVPGFRFSDWGGRGARDRPGFELETE